MSKCRDLLIGTLLAGFAAQPLLAQTAAAPAAPAEAGPAADAAAARERYLAAGGEVLADIPKGPRWGLIIDALFGIAPAAPVAAPSQSIRSGELQRRIRVAFVADLEGRLRELDAALAAQDSDNAGRLLHGLKGSAAYLDETQLHMLCTEMEEAADGGRWTQVALHLPQLRALLAQIAVSGKEM